MSMEADAFSSLLADAAARDEPTAFERFKHAVADNLDRAAFAMLHAAHEHQEAAEARIAR